MLNRLKSLFILGLWATLGFSAQTVATAQVPRFPFSDYPTQSQATNLASQVVSDLEEYSTNAFAVSTTILQNYADLTTSQTISNKHLFDATSTNASFGIANAWITNANFYGAVNVSNSAPRVIIYDTDGPTDEKYTEITSYGGDFTIQTAKDDNSANQVIMQVSRTSYTVDSIYFGADVDMEESLTVGDLLIAGTITNTPIVDATITDSTYSGTISSLSSGTITGTTLTNVTAYGTVGLLSGGYMNGVGSTNMSATNATLKGVAQVSGGMAYNRANHTAFANGGNAAADFGSAVFIKIKAGPSAAFSIAGIANGTDGKMYVLYNATGQNMTISNDSGTDPTPANRIYTGTGADIATTANGVVTVVYDSEDSRWIVTSIRD